MYPVWHLVFSIQFLRNTFSCSFLVLWIFLVFKSIWGPESNVANHQLDGSGRILPRRFRFSWRVELWIVDSIEYEDLHMVLDLIRFNVHTSPSVAVSYKIIMRGLFLRKIKIETGPCIPHQCCANIYFESKCPFAFCSCGRINL
jgi:hypothetical protein